MSFSTAKVESLPPWFQDNDMRLDLKKNNEHIGVIWVFDTGLEIIKESLAKMSLKSNSTLEELVE